MHPNRRRKKRSNYGMRTVEVMRGCSGFGFTISGQQPCILSCIVNNSPADQAGLRAGDFLISVNGVSVSKLNHDAVVNLIGNCVGPIKMTIAENYYSDSSEDELECGRIVYNRKPKYMHKPRTNRALKSDLRRVAVSSTNVKVTSKSRDFSSNQSSHNISPHSSALAVGTSSKVLNISNILPVEDEVGPVEYKVLVGYLGTIEMPKQLLPNSRLQIVCSCIRKLRQEKRTPTAILITVLPNCLTLKNSVNHILAIYPTNRVVYVGSSTDKESKYFGIVTSAVCDNRSDSFSNKDCKNTASEPTYDMEISNSCHVFVTDPKLVDHNVHAKKADTFRFSCTVDPSTGQCLEFPQNALAIVNLVQTMYKLQNSEHSTQSDGNLPVAANSPQPSASSNSDSGIGFRDDFGGVSDRILVVEFPTHRPLPTVSNSHRPQGIDGSNLPLDALDIPLDQFHSNQAGLNNATENEHGKLKHLNKLNNVRACEAISIRNHIVKPDIKLGKQRNENTSNYNKLTCRAMPDLVTKGYKFSNATRSTNLDSGTRKVTTNNTVEFLNETVNVPDSFVFRKAGDNYVSQSLEDVHFKSSTDNISVNSSKSVEFAHLKNVFRIPIKKNKKYQKIASCESLGDVMEHTNYKLSPKVYGTAKVHYSCGELNNMDAVGYGSLQELNTCPEPASSMRTIAQSEPDVRIQRDCNEYLCDQTGVAKCSTEGPAVWATSFEKLLEDPLGLHAFAEFLKKEFSAENIYFWTACERYRKLPPGNERDAEAQRIYQQHLSVGASEAVNVDAQGRQCAEQALSNPDITIFDQAQKQIFNLMKFDSYPRFLKSDIYKQCLSGEVNRSQIDTDLLTHTPSSTPSKLKKSLSNAEDRRRKSLLPWHRKTRSKSKDRGEVDYGQKKNDIPSRVDNDNLDNQLEQQSRFHDNCSSKSSLTSLDLAISNQELVKSKAGNQEDVPGSRTALCRVILSNGSTTVVQIKDIETIHQLVSRVLEKRGFTYSSFEVFTNKHHKAVDVNESSMRLAGCEVTVEQRVVFKLDLPNRKIISVKSKYTKIIVDVLRPILHKYNYNLDQVIVTNLGKPLDIYLPVTTIDGARLNIQLKVGNDEKNDSVSSPVKPNANMTKANRLEEITNKVFEGILQEKAETVAAEKVARSDKGSIKSEDWGSEHSSGIFGKFLRRDSGIQERKKKSIIPRGILNTNNEVEETITDNNCKKPLIAKWKTGATKFNVSNCSESDELVEGLTRAQRRLEDQRGTEINFELPDFLKDKENEQTCSQNTRSYMGGSSYSDIEKSPAAKNIRMDVHSNYENRNVTVSDTSPVKQLLSLGTCVQASPIKGGCKLQEVKGRNSDPPPLPPKPKIVPIKPPNWGQNGFYNKDFSTEKNQGMFLEHPSSSFV